MNILFTTIGFYPAEAWGGPVKIVDQNARELQRRGHHVTVAATNLADKHHRITPRSSRSTVDGLGVHYLETRNLPTWPGTLGPTWLAPAAVMRLQQMLAAADIVHVNATRNAVSLGAMRIAARVGTPTVLQPHGTLPHIVNSVRLKRAFDALVLRRLLKKVDYFIAGQPAERSQILAVGAASDRIRTIPNGIDSEQKKFPPAGQFRRRYGIAPEQTVILFLGRINRKKGTDLLVQAFARLSESQRKQLQLVVAGPDDGQLAEVKRLVREHRLDDAVLLPGLLTGDDVWAAYADADLFVLPCRVDTFPMAIVEACSAGLPMVVTETCEIAHLLDGKAAKIVPVDVDAIAEGIRTVLDSPGLQARYRDGAQELMRTAFSIEAVGDQLEALYEHVIAEKQRAA